MRVQACDQHLCGVDSIPVVLRPRNDRHGRPIHESAGSAERSGDEVSRQLDDELISR